MKIAISIPDEISDWVNQEATRKKQSRSRFITHALTEYRRREKNQVLLLNINRAFENTDASLSPAYKSRHYNLISDDDKF